MFTVCPKCALTLVVTAADLRVAQGYVRCGRCSNVFSALARLSEGREEHLQEAQQSPAEPPHDSIVEDDLEFHPEKTDVTKVFIEQPASAEFQAAAAGLRRQVGEPSGATNTPHTHAAPSSRQDEAETGAAPSSQQDEAETHAAVADPPDETPSRADSAASAPEIELAPTRIQTPGLRAIADVLEQLGARARSALQWLVSGPRVVMARFFPGAQAEDPADGAAVAPAWLARGWAAGSVVLVILLVVQVVHHYRHELAATGMFNKPLTTVYAALGVPLVPRWDLAAYEVHQLGAASDTDNPGRIIVRASVKNVGRMQQPLPLLRVTLQDQFGNRLSSRDVSAQAYLPRAISRLAKLSPGQRVDAEMTFVDPGANAVGFEIDACLPAPDGGIVCAAEAER